MHSNVHDFCQLTYSVAATTLTQLQNTSITTHYGKSGKLNLLDICRSAEQCGTVPAKSSLPSSRQLRLPSSPGAVRTSNLLVMASRLSGTRDPDIHSVQPLLSLAHGQTPHCNSTAVAAVIVLVAVVLIVLIER
jgi:hypothetical protein